MRFPLGNLHIPIVESQDPDAKYSPLGENTTLLTQYECPVRVLIHSPLDTLHTSIVESLDMKKDPVPDTKYSMFGENATLKTGDE